MISTMDTDPMILVAQAKAGEGEALGRLVERHRNYLILLARMQIGNRLQGKLDEEDLIQETSLEAHRGITRFRGQTEPEFRTWLRQILAGVLAHQVRRYQGTRRRDLRLERALAAGLDQSSWALGRGLIDPHSTPSHGAKLREQAVLLADALSKIPDDYREVIVLRQIEDLSFAEVAARMGRTENSVKNLWVRALARMRRAMEDPR